MKIRILSPSRTKQSFILQGEEEYLKRLRSFAQIERIEIPVSAPSSLPERDVMKMERDAISSRVRKDEFLIVLDEKGKELTSPAFASFLDRRMQSGDSRLAFIIGGAFGIDPALKKSADFTLSLSTLTFPYQLTRLILIEQLYRAFSILKGIPYHK